MTSHCTHHLHIYITHVVFGSIRPAGNKRVEVLGPFTLSFSYMACCQSVICFVLFFINFFFSAPTNHHRLYSRTRLHVCYISSTKTCLLSHSHTFYLLSCGNHSQSMNIAKRISDQRALERERLGKVMKRKIYQNLKITFLVSDSEFEGGREGEREREFLMKYFHHSGLRPLSNKKKRYKVCGRKMDKKTHYTCIMRKEYKCNTHKVKLCPSCVAQAGIVSFRFVQK